MPKGIITPNAITPCFRQYLRAYFPNPGRMRMAPLRHRDVRVASPTNPTTARHVARGLTINIPLANNTNTNPNTSKELHVNDELEIAFAAKEVELSALLSPLDNNPVPANPSFQKQIHSHQLKFLPVQVIDSSETFNLMKTEFLSYLSQNKLSHLVPESKLYRSVYFRYG
jgi:hypothetical protein